MLVSLERVDGPRVPFWYYSDKEKKKDQICTFSLIIFNQFHRIYFKSIYEATMAEYQHIRRHYDDRNEIVFQKYVWGNSVWISAYTSTILRSAWDRIWKVYMKRQWLNISIYVDNMTIGMRSYLKSIYEATMAQ